MLKSTKRRCLMPSMSIARICVKQHQKRKSVMKCRAEAENLGVKKVQAEQEPVVHVHQSGLEAELPSDQLANKITPYNKIKKSIVLLLNQLSHLKLKMA